MALVSATRENAGSGLSDDDVDTDIANLLPCLPELGGLRGRFSESLRGIIETHPLSMRVDLERPPAEELPHA